MGVDKQITYDLTQLTAESANALADQFEDIIKKETKAKKKKKKLKDEEKEEEKEEKKTKSKVKDISSKEVAEEFPVTDIGTQGGISFFVNQFKSSLPLITPILIASAFFITHLLKLDKLEKKFIDIADTRISIFVDRQEQARLDNHLEQTIYTTKAGTAIPRDSYNSFNEYDRVLKKDGIDRNASTIGGVD